MGGYRAEGNGREAAASAFAMCSEYQCQPLFVATAVGQRATAPLLSPFFSYASFPLSGRVSAERQHGLTHAKREPPLFTRLTSSIACLESLLRRRRLLVHGFASISRAALENIDSFLCIFFKRMQIKGAVHAICISL